MFPDLTCDDDFRIETGRLWLRRARRRVAEATAMILHPYYGQENAESFLIRARGAHAAGIG